MNWRTSSPVFAAAMACATGLVTRPSRADDAACVAASEQALTLRQQGKLHDALTQLAVCSDDACPAEIKSECAQRIREANAAMPTLILAVKDAAGNDVFDVSVSMDGAPLSHALEGRATAIDPGAHTFTFEASGQDPIVKKLVLREGDKDRREVIMTGHPLPAPEPVVPAAPSTAATASSITAPSTASPSASSLAWGPQRTAAAAAVGLGIVGLGLELGSADSRFSSQNREKTDCSPGACLRPWQATEDYDTAQKDATGATIAVSVGVVAVAAGVVLWLVAPKNAPRVGLAPALGGRGLSLRADL